MRNNFKLILLAAASIFVLGSCAEEESVNVYDGPTSVYIRSANATSLLVDDGIATTQEVPVVVTLAGALASDVTITFAVDPDATTAVEGTHYSLASNSLTIAAGEVSDTLLVTGLIDGFEGDPSVSLRLTLVMSSDDVNVIQTSNTKTLNLGITCPSTIPLGTYTTADPSAALDPDGCSSGAGGTAVNVTISYDEDSGLYTLSDGDIGYFVGDYVVPVNFRDVCNGLTVLGSPDAPYNIQFIGSGVFVPGGGANGTGQIVFQCYYDETYAGPAGTESIAFDAPAQ